MASTLFTPILNDRTRAPNFFNGRLLTGEAMTDEQEATRVARELLTEAVGDGVAWGLQVESAPSASTTQRPVVNVRAGVALNRRGEVLLLKDDTQVQLVPPANVIPVPDTIFQTCTPVSTGVYVADAGVYLLTISSIRAGNGMTQVSGLGDTPRGCNIKYIVDAVEFRLLSLPVDAITLGDVAHLRNLVAYQCFGVDHLDDFAIDPFAAPAAPRTLLDQIRGTDLTDCDVPLAVLYWTATGGIQFIDLWSVRRRVTRTMSASRFELNDVRLAAAEAMRDQFAAQIQSMLDGGQTLIAVRATDVFRWLPPAGLVPLAGGAGARGFDVITFFSGKSWNYHPGWPAPIYMEGGMVETLLRDSAKYPPVDLQDKEMVWLYSVRQNISTLNTGSAVHPYAVFANANMPFFGDPRVDRAHFNYSNFV